MENATLLELRIFPLFAMVSEVIDDSIKIHLSCSLTIWSVIPLFSSGEIEPHIIQ